MRTNGNGTAGDCEGVRAPRSPIDLSAQTSWITILLVDDQDERRITTKWFLSNFGYVVVTARSAEQALATFIPEIHDVVVTDNTMPGVSGVEMAHIMKLRSPTTPVIMYTSEPPEDMSCVDVVIQRPAHLLKLKYAIEDALAGYKS